MDDAIKWLAGQGSATAADFRAHFGQRADQMREGLAAHGYTQQRDGRIALTEAGLRKLAAISEVEGIGNGVGEG